MGAFQGTHQCEICQVTQQQLPHHNVSEQKLTSSVQYNMLFTGKLWLLSAKEQKTGNVLKALFEEHILC